MKPLLLRRLLSRDTQSRNSGRDQFTTSHPCGVAASRRDLQAHSRGRPVVETCSACTNVIEDQTRDTHLAVLALAPDRRNDRRSRQSIAVADPPDEMDVVPVDLVAKRKAEPAILFPRNTIHILHNCPVAIAAAKVSWTCTCQARRSCTRSTRVHATDKQVPAFSPWTDSLILL